MCPTRSGSAPIELPIETCWEKLRDLTLAKFYVPGVSACQIVTEQKEGVGTSRVVTTPQTGDMHETVTEWNEGQGFSIRLHKGEKPPTPFREAHFHYRLIPTGPQTCEIHTEMDYTPSFGVLGRILDRLLLGPMTRKSTQAVAAGLAAYYERVERTGP